MSATIVRSSQELAELEKLKELTVKSPAIPAVVAHPEPSVPLTLEQAITETVTAAVTKKVIETPAAALESESSELEPLDEDIDEQADNEIDEADTAAASEIPAKISTPLQSPQAVVLLPEIVALLRAALRANLQHVVIKVLSIALEEK